jgi:hypothetical protein
MESKMKDIVITVSAHNREAYVDALDAVLLSRCDALDADATWESVMHLREQLAGKRFEYPGQ